MRWYKKEKPIIPHRTTRKVTEFLLFPKTLHNPCWGKLQTRWLETAEICEYYDAYRKQWRDDCWWGS
jgi:hypothetical protein